MYVGFLKKKFTPWEVWSQQPSWGGWMGEVRGQEKFFMLCINIWVPHEILRSLSIHTWGKIEILPPTTCLEDFSGAFSAK